MKSQLPAIEAKENVWRLQLKPKGGAPLSERSPEERFDYCLREKVLGVGWSVNTGSGKSLSWEQYLALATSSWTRADLFSVCSLHDKVKEDDLIWTRDTRGHYYLARVTAPWEYCPTKEAWAVDIVNVVKCDIEPVRIDQVPGKIVSTFRRGRALQRVGDPTAQFYSKLLWNQLAGESRYAVEEGVEKNIYSCLDDKMTEDVVFIYLQEQDWIAVPSSRQKDTKGYEYYLINRRTHEVAEVQVKAGSAQIGKEYWKPSPQVDKVFLFQADGQYLEGPGEKIETIAPEVLETFMREHFEIMPGAVQQWLRYTQA